MSAWTNIRFKHKLFALFILLSSIPALLIGFTAYQKSSTMFHSKTEQDLNVILAQLNTSIERQIGDFDRFSMLPYYLPDIFSFLNKPYVSPDQLGSAQIKAQRTMDRLMSAYPSINSSISGLMIYGVNGTVNGYRMNGSSALNHDVNAKKQEWYQEVMKDKGGFVVTGVREIDQFTGQPFEALIGSRLLMDEEYRPLAVIAIFISPNFIPRLVQSLELPTLQVTVVDRSGKLIYASDAELAQRLMEAGSGSKRGSWEISVPAGAQSTTYSGVYLESNYSGWKTYLGVDRNEMIKASRSIRNFTFTIVIGIVLLAGVFSWLFAKSLSKPIYRMIRSMRAVEKGNFTVPAAMEREDEIGRLESSYGRMVYRVGELVQSIEEKERQKRHAELYALRARIQPHFLYNTLNSIRMLAILQQSPQIAKLIQSLSKLLRANMRLDNELVTLEEEIKLLKDYASLMDLRYTNVFDMEWRIEPDAVQAALPTMLLQPLLENAIFHGAKGLERKLNIAVSARREQSGRLLAIEIIDDGAGLKEGFSFIPSSGEQDDASDRIGLHNVHDRIRLRFGEPYGLTAERRDGMTVVRLMLPYTQMEQEGG